MIAIQRVKAVPGGLKRLLPTSARRHLRSDNIILVATLEGQSVGILVASLEPSIFAGILNALAVKEPFRRRGIATQLVAALDAILKESECLMAMVVYEASDPFATPFEHILAHNHWKPPQPHLQRYHYEVQRFHPPWLARTYDLPPDFEEFPWQQLTTADRELIRRQLRGGTFPPSVYPLGSEESLIEPLNSLGLRYQGDIVGWMVTHRIAPDTIRYSYLYVRPDLRYHKYSIRLLTDAIKLQQASTVPLSTFEISEAPARWNQFVERRLAPYAQSVSEMRQSWKDLREENGRR